MKKSVFVWMTLVLTGVVFSGSITVNSPAASSQWIKGSTYSIAWTPAGCANQDYKINIFKNTVDQANFVEQLTVSGITSKSWTVPGSYQAGNYIIRVKTADNLCIGDSPVFQVVEPQQVTPTLSVVTPTPGSVWEKGYTYAVTWTKTGTQSPTVKVNIFKNSIDQANFVEQLSGPNSGSLNWNIPVSYQSGNYYLRIKPDDNSCYGDSPMFQITDHPVVPESTIEITNPHAGLVWRKGITYTITWNKTGSQGSQVNIILFKDSAASENIKSQFTAPNTGARSWTVPESFETGTYYMKIITTDNEVSDYSEPFQIKTKYMVALEKEMTAMPLHAKIEILKPSSSSFWDEGTSQEIRWKNQFTKDKNVKIDLYNFSGNQFVRNIKTILALKVKKLIGSQSADTGYASTSWAVPQGLGPAKYRIKIATTDGRASGMSEMFTVRIKTAVKTYTLDGVYGNYCKRSYWASSGSVALANLQAQVGNCTGVGGSSKGWAGYANYMMNNQMLYYGDIWRTHAVFDLSQFAGKGVILKAKLKISKSYYPSGADCEVRVWKLNTPLGDAFNINCERVDTPETNMVSIAQGWVAYPGSNHGIMITGPDESFRHDQSQCKIFLNSIRLEIEFLEKE